MHTENYLFYNSYNSSMKNCMRMSNCSLAASGISTFKYCHWACLPQNALYWTSHPKTHSRLCRTHNIEKSLNLVPFVLVLLFQRWIFAGFLIFCNTKLRRYLWVMDNLWNKSSNRHFGPWWYLISFLLYFKHELKTKIMTIYSPKTYYHQQQ